MQLQVVSDLELNIIVMAILKILLYYKMSVIFSNEFSTNDCIALADLD